MRKKSGFTLIEVLAVLAILAVLIIIAVPVSFNVFKKIKNDNLNEKISMIEVAANNYASKIKDEVKNAKNTETGSLCKTTSVEELITLGYLSSEKENANVMINPVDNMELSDLVQMCYCESILDVVSYYTKEYKENTSYRKNDKIWQDNKLYKVLKNYTSQSIEVDLKNGNIIEVNVCDLGESEIIVNFETYGGVIKRTTNDGLIDNNGKIAKKYNKDDKYGILPTATKVGYVFNKWLYNNKIEVKETDKIKVNQTHTLTADYTPIRYRIEYSLNGGTFGSTHPDYGKYDTIVTISNPTKEVIVKINNDEGATLSQSEVRVAQKFRGWKASGVGLNAKANDEAWNGDILTFASNFLNLRDDTNTSVIFDAGWEDETITIPTATKPGYKCYITEDSAKINKITTPTYTIHGGKPSTVNLYVKCDPDNFTVTFNANGGSVSPTSKQVLYGLSYGDLPTPTKNLYTFDGWYDSNNNKIYNTTLVSIASNHTLTAHWSPRSDILYNVVYKFESANKYTTPTTNIYDESMTRTSTRSGSTNQEISVTPETVNGFVTPRSQTIKLDQENKTLTFYYIRKYVDVIYHSKRNGDAYNVFSKKDDGLLVYGGGQSFLNPGTRTGYHPVGWSPYETNQSREIYYINSDATVINNFVEKYYSSKKLYVVEEPNTYTIKYDCNANASTSHAYGTNTYLASSSICSRTGYNLTGWVYNGTSYSPGGNIKYFNGEHGTTYTFNAQWTAQTYDVSFNSNGGSGNMSSTKFTYNISKQLPANTFTRSGYEFLGWSTSPAATSASYSNLSYMTVTSDTTLYAVWKTSCPAVGTTWNFESTGAEQILNLQCAGTYKLEVWGSQGSKLFDNWNDTGCNKVDGINKLQADGGYGGYSGGKVYLNAGEQLFINVGNGGTNVAEYKMSGKCGDSEDAYLASGTSSGGYNGGGSTNSSYKAPGGGATHIATTSGLLDNIKGVNGSDVLIVAAGGNGAYKGSYNHIHSGYNASGYSLGKYENIGNGEGGGWLKKAKGASSGYIGNPRLFDGVMYCYECLDDQLSKSHYTVSTTETTSGNTISEASIIQSNKAKIGNGFAKITYVSSDNLTPTGSTFKNQILNDNYVSSSAAQTTAKISSSEKSGLYLKDNVYFFRGSAKNNFVTFANKTWRIVRINADGTVRIIIDEKISSSSTKYNTSTKDKKYMYYSNSTIKGEIETWYNSNLKSYDSKIASGNYFCEQAKVSLSGYDAKSGAAMSMPSDYTPSFSCSKDSNEKGIVSAKVGLLSYDDLVFAGAFYNKSSSIYLSTSYHFWSMSPVGYDGSAAYIWYLTNDGKLSRVVTNTKNIHPYARPVINLVSTVKAVSGNGTELNPYVIQ